MTRKLEEDLRINDPLGIDGDDSDTSSWSEATGSSPEDNVFELGIRPMEPLQPSSKTKKKARGSRMTGDNIEDLERQMKEAAARLDFEEAARIRDIIRGIK